MRRCNQSHNLTSSLHIYPMKTVKYTQILLSLRPKYKSPLNFVIIFQILKMTFQKTKSINQQSFCVNVSGRHDSYQRRFLLEGITLKLATLFQILKTFLKSSGYLKGRVSKCLKGDILLLTCKSSSLYNIYIYIYIFMHTGSN